MICALDREVLSNAPLTNGVRYRKCETSVSYVRRRELTFTSSTSHDLSPDAGRIDHRRCRQILSAATAYPDAVSGVVPSQAAQIWFSHPRATLASSISWAISISTSLSASSLCGNRLTGRLTASRIC